MRTIEWADGRRMSDRTWAGLFRQLNRLKWNQDYSPVELREQLAKRAWEWSYYAVVNVQGLSYKRLFEELARAKMLRIVPEEVTK